MNEDRVKIECDISEAAQNGNIDLFLNLYLLCDFELNPAILCFSIIGANETIVSLVTQKCEKIVYWSIAEIVINIIERFERPRFYPALRKVLDSSLQIRLDEYLREDV
jgi:hypothetical protein